MKAICPRCKAEYDVEQQETEIEAECPCGQKFIVAARQNRPSIDKPNLPLPKPHAVPPGVALVECPDCGRQVSRHAVACPGCGRPIASPQRASTRPAAAATTAAAVHGGAEFAETYIPKPNLIIGLGLCGLGLACLIPAAGFDLPGWYAGTFWGMLFGLICLSVRHVDCHRCGHKGSGKMISSPNGCAFFLLLLLGVIPAFIYYFIVKIKYRCIKCGQLTD